MVRVGIVGAGWVARMRHLPALRPLPDVELTGVWSRSPDKARQVRDEFGIPTTYESWEALVADPGVDAVVVATPPKLHMAASMAALQHGKHVLCQGRMARNLREARLMLAAARASGRVAALYPPRPGLKGDRVMRRLLADGYVGDVREVRVTGMAFDPGEGYSWSSDPEVVGVNAMTLGMWAEVCNRWVGPAARVAAVGRCHLPMRLTAGGDRAEAAVPDSLAIAAELTCGATATYHLALRAAFGPGHAIEIYGSRGALVYKLFAEEIQGATEGEQALHSIAIPADEERAHSTDVEFIAAIRGGAPVSPSFEDGVRYMEFCEAVALSLRTGAAVPVPPAAPAMESWGQPISA